MALENIQELEQTFGLEEGKLKEMITSEDNHKIDLEPYVISKKEDYESRLENIKKESKVAAVEIAIKNARNELGLDFQGKTMENLLESFKAKVEADSKIEPNQKVSELQKDLDTLRKANGDWEGKFNDLQGTYKQKEQQRTINNTLLKAIPDNTTIPKEDVLAILRAKYDFSIGDDGFEIAKDGVVQKNTTTLNKLTPKEFMTDVINPYLKKPDGGAGGSDSSNDGKETSLELFTKKMADKGISVGSEKYNQEMSLAISNKTLTF